MWYIFLIVYFSFRLPAGIGSGAPSEEKGDKAKKIFFKCDALAELNVVEYFMEASATVRTLQEFAAKTVEKPIEGIALFKDAMPIKGFADLFELHTGDVISITFTNN